jgi:23S rRNA (guanosine2251-2'-O)-methyltransferase
VVQSRKKKHPKLLGSHQRSWVWGRHAVLEILHAQQWPAREVYLDEALAPGDLCVARSLAEQMGATITIEPAERLTQLCNTAEHQGYLARMRPFPYADADAMLAHPALDGSGAAPLFALLDGIQDPFNFGAIIRSAEALGVAAVAIGGHRQAEVTSQVARSSAGAVNRLPIVRVEDLPDLARRLQERGVRLAAASEKAARACSDWDFSTPAALVLGNEGHGVSPELMDLCDVRLCVPQHGGIGSLNVAAAAAILFYEAARQRTPQAGRE